MNISEVLGIVMASLSLTISALFFLKCRDCGRFCPLAVVGWIFLALHAILRVAGVSAFLREVLTYLFALSISLYIVLNAVEFNPQSARLMWMYMLTPVSHLFYRVVKYAGVNLPVGVGGIAGDSGVMLLITAYVSYVTFRRAILSLSLIPIGLVLFFYKVVQGTPVGFSLMAFGITVFALATVRVVSLRLFKGGRVPEVETTGLVLVDEMKLKSLLDKYRGSPVLFLTRREGEFPENWSVFRLSSVPLRNSIPPTALERLRHVIVKYLVEAKKSGSRGLVVLDCLDFLILHNEGVAVLKFLGDVRDHAVVNDGVIFVVVSGSMDEHTRRLLEKLSDGKI